LGYILGDFFTDASGHPGGECEFVSESGDLASPTAPFSFLFLVVPQGDQNWANFRLLGNCFLWAVFLKITDVAQILGLLFSTVKVMH
jgi:hypothetical protein